MKFILFCYLLLNVANSYGQNENSDQQTTPSSGSDWSTTPSGEFDWSTSFSESDWSTTPSGEFDWSTSFSESDWSTTPSSEYDWSTSSFGESDWSTTPSSEYDWTTSSFRESDWSTTPSSEYERTTTPYDENHHSQNKKCSCGKREHSGSNGTVRSHEGNGNYCNNMNCHYHITAPKGYHIVLRLEGRTEKCCDHIIFNNNMHVRYSGDLAGRVVYSDSNVLGFRFVTDGSIVNKGFVGKYEVNSDKICYNGGVMLEDRMSSGCYCQNHFYGNKCQYDGNRKCGRN